MTWKPDEFEIAYVTGPYAVSGYTYRGLGLHILNPLPKKGRHSAQWGLSHLGTGHRLCMMEGDVATVFPIATEIAEAGDWGFISLLGYKDRFPDAAYMLREICERYPRVVFYKATKEKVAIDPKADEVARQIASNRP